MGFNIIHTSVGAGRHGFITTMQAAQMRVTSLIEALLAKPKIAKDWN